MPCDSLDSRRVGWIGSFAISLFVGLNGPAPDPIEEGVNKVLGVVCFPKPGVAQRDAGRGKREVPGVSHREDGPGREVLCPL